MVVDAKCSLTAFVEASRAVEEDARDAALSAHVASVRTHARGLAGKAYGEVVRQRTLDLVLMFIPSEAAFHAAIARDAGLYADAFRQGIVLCSPTTLLAALQLIAHLWRSERQGENARRIAEEAGKLLEKLTAFAGDLDAVGMRLDQARASFETAHARFVTGRGNVVRKARELAALGAPLRSAKARELLAPVHDGDSSEEVYDSVPGDEASEGHGRSEEVNTSGAARPRALSTGAGVAEKAGVGQE